MWRGRRDLSTSSARLHFTAIRSTIREAEAYYQENGQSYISQTHPQQYPSGGRPTHRLLHITLQRRTFHRKGSARRLKHQWHQVRDTLGTTQQASKHSHKRLFVRWQHTLYLMTASTSQWPMERTTRCFSNQDVNMSTSFSKEESSSAQRIKFAPIPSSPGHRGATNVFDYCLRWISKTRKLRVRKREVIWLWQNSKKNTEVLEM